MIISELIGGLGNQMFQYAAGLAIAKRCNLEYRIDNSQFINYPLRPYALDDYCISTPIASENEMYKISSEGELLLESGSKFEPRLFDSFQKLYLRGYWQSEEYFKDIRQQLLSEFIPYEQLDQSSINVIDYMKTSTSVMMHIRRGDYISNAHTNSFHGVMPLEYYQSGISHIKENLNELEIGKVVYFVFSDDPDWCEVAFEWLDPKVIVRHNSPERGFIDIYLMSQCKHHIIANSSFSWWGSWLCQNPNQIVVAPKQWFAMNTVDSDHIVPARWVRL